MIEVIKQFFGGSVSAVEAFVGSVGIMGILSIMISIFFNVYKGKKTKKEIDSIKAENKAILDDFIQEHNEELKTLKSGLTSDLDKISNMLMLEAMKNGIDLDTFNQLKELYIKVIKEEILDTDKLQEEKQEQVENEQTNQEAINENINNIESLMNSDLV